MPDAVEELAIYLHLARASQQRGRPLVRDRLLVLAGVRAAGLGLDRVYQLCRRRILIHNPAHLLHDFARLPPPGADERLDALLAQLERKFPREKAEHMLRSLGIQLAGERATYRDAEEYALSLLDATADELQQLDQPVATPTDATSIAAQPSQPIQPIHSARYRPWWRFGQPTPWGNVLFGCLPLLAFLIAVLAAWLLPLIHRGLASWRMLFP